MILVVKLAQSQVVGSRHCVVVDGEINQYNLSCQFCQGAFLALQVFEFDIDDAESMEEIRAREKAEAEAKRHQQKAAVLASASELQILAALIQCEAGGEPYEGQVAVGSVVMNRVRCAAYPNTVTEVIYASGQFTPAVTGKLDRVVLSGNIKPSCLQAAQEVLNGVTNIGDALHFRRVGSKQGIVIGNHVFW